MSYKADPWNSDGRLDVLESKVFPDMFQLCTDIFHISESTAVNPRKGARVPAKDVRLKVLLPTEYSPYHEYKGAIKVGNSWMIIDYSIQVIAFQYFHTCFLLHYTKLVGVPETAKSIHNR